MTIPLSKTRLFFGAHKNKTFDEIPLRYLDWLSGQDWVYGPLRDRLTAFLNHPNVEIWSHVEDALDSKKKVPNPSEGFWWDWEDKTETRAFSPSVTKIQGEGLWKTHGPPTWLPTYYNPPNPTPDERYLPTRPTAVANREYDPSEEREFIIQDDRDWRPPKMTAKKAWTILADIAVAVEKARTIEELENLPSAAKEIAPFIPKETMTKVRTQYRDRRRLVAALAAVPEARREDALALAEMIEANPTIELDARDAHPDLVDIIDLLTTVGEIESPYLSIGH